MLLVQLRGKDFGTPWNDGETAGAGNRLQNHGSRQGLDEGQKEGKLFIIL